MITLYGGRFRTHIDLFGWWLPEVDAATQLTSSAASQTWAPPAVLPLGEEPRRPPLRDVPELLTDHPGGSSLF